MKAENWLTLWLDIWTSSIWWALTQENNEKINLINWWVRIFQEPRHPKTKKILNKVRREKRGQRRIIKRKNERIKKLKEHLIKFWLFPKEIKEQQIYYWLNPYKIRARWLDEKLDFFELGRALLHIWQRRGFKSNRKTPNKKEETWMLKEISELQKEIEDNNCRTLWEYFNKLQKTWIDVRWKHTRRDMYEKEFELIIEKQKEFYWDKLDKNIVRQLKRDIFFQNPLRIQKDLIWNCLYFKNRKRAHSLTLRSQDFRIWQEINNLRYFDSFWDQRPFLKDQREKIYKLFLKKKEVRFPDIKKEVWLHKDTRINFEKTRKYLKGNSTYIDLLNIVWEYWHTLDINRKDELVRYLIDIWSPWKLSEVLKNKFWDFLNDENISKILELDFSISKYSNLSEKAIKKILPILKEKNQTKTTNDWEIIDESPITYREAVDILGLKELEKYDFSKDKDLKIDYRNPSVVKAMVEVKKITKAIEKNFWIPEKIRIELWKEMKMSQEDVKKIEKKIKENEERNKNVRIKINEIFQELWKSWEPTREDVIKYKLYLECEEKWMWVCPYTWKKITPRQVFNWEIDVEHIIPYSRSLDDSFLNKTLCYADFNRQIKWNKTPFEIFSWNPEEYEKVKQRIANYSYWKRQRFEQKEINLDKFLNQQLVDTQYIWQEIRKFLESYFNKKSKISITKWVLTSTLRYSWWYNRFLWDENHSEEIKKTKNRWDHRHHFIDAVITALTSQSILQKASILSWKNKLLKKEEIFWDLKPSKEFEKELNEKLENMIISFAPKHRISWALHQETWYWVLSDESVKKLKIWEIKDWIWYFVRRVPLDEEFNVEKIKYIYDKEVRKLVCDLMYSEEIKHNPKIAFPKIWEWKLFHKDWKTPIKSVRIYEKKSLDWIYNYKWEWNLFYESWSNHHVEILEHKRKTNKDWTPLRKGIFVTMMDAATRVNKKLELVQRKWPWVSWEEILSDDDWKFICSLMKGDMVEFEDKIYRVQKMSWADGTVWYTLQFETVSDKCMRRSPNSFQVKKIQVSPLWDKYNSND